jgi:hypothetical protein
MVRPSKIKYGCLRKNVLMIPTSVLTVGLLTELNLFNI